MEQSEVKCAALLCRTAHLVEKDATAKFGCGLKTDKEHLSLKYSPCGKWGITAFFIGSFRQGEALQNTSYLFTITYYFQSPKGEFSEE
ncbi:MAG: hypothetical protein ACI39E_03320 [Acutalibacteraceae bacterium]